MTSLLFLTPRHPLPRFSEPIAYTDFLFIFLEIFYAHTRKYVHTPLSSFLNINCSALVNTVLCFYGSYLLLLLLLLLLAIIHLIDKAI